MGKMNTITKDYMSKPDYFADCFNYYLFDGRQVIKSESLQVRDSTELAVIPQNISLETVEKYRDILKQCVLMEDDEVTYLMLGIENHTEIHYALPVKNMIYDSLNYGKQVSDRANVHRQKKDLKISGEFLSGFAKEDRLKPIITLVVYFGADDWDAPRSLKEMFETTDDTILSFVEDYRVHLIIPNEIEDFDKFKTDFGKAMKYIAASKDKNKLRKVQSEEAFRSVDVETVKLLNACTNVKIPIEEGEEKVNMCKGWEDLIEEEREEGRAEGRANMIMTALAGGSTMEEVAKVMCIPIEEVKGLVSQN